MDGKLFTPAFRQKLKRIVRTASPSEAPALAAKVSPVFSILGAALVLLKLEHYSYLTFTLVLLPAITLGALVAYMLPKLVLWPMHLLTLEPKDLIHASRRESDEESE